MKHYTPQVVWNMARRETFKARKHMPFPGKHPVRWLVRVEFPDGRKLLYVGKPPLPLLFKVLSRKGRPVRWDVICFDRGQIVFRENMGLRSLCKGALRRYFGTTVYDGFIMNAEPHRFTDNFGKSEIVYLPRQWKESDKFYLGKDALGPLMRPGAASNPEGYASWKLEKVEAL